MFIFFSSQFFCSEKKFEFLYFYYLFTGTIHSEKHIFRVFYLFFNLWSKIYLTVNDGFDREL